MNLMHVLAEVAGTINQTGIPYVIGGSAATVMNGCTSIQPNDIDVILKNAPDVEKVVCLFEAFLPESQVVEHTDVSKWRSTPSQPVITFADHSNYTWTFARFVIRGVKVEIGSIEPTPDFEYVPATGIWESGPSVWPYIKRVVIKDTDIPVLPLEIQLETNMNRGLEDRIANIIEVFRSEGYDSELLRFSLGKENYLNVIESIQET